MTFGESKWYSNINPLDLNSRAAIGVLGRWRDYELVAAVSAFPIVANGLSVSLPKVLESVTGKTIISRSIRVKLGRFLDESYNAIKDQIVHIEILQEHGNRLNLHKGHSYSSVEKPPEALLKSQHEVEPVTEEDLWQRSGVLAVGLRQSDYSWASNRALSLQINDVASDFTNIGFRVQEIMELLHDYLDVVRE
jgi:hypothetical protein